MPKANLTVVASAPPSRPVSLWRQDIGAAWQKGAESVFETGQLLIQAKADLPHGEFEAMVERDLPFGPRTARMLMAVAEHPIISNRKHVSVLPPSWGTLYELTKLPPPVLEAKIEDGTITPKIERKAVAALRPPASAPTKKKKRRPGNSTVPYEPESQHDRDLKYLRGVWEGCCASARAQFLKDLGYEPHEETANV